nr:MAG TPA: hypothetical protein [Caudoviricetes sp.]
MNSILIFDSHFQILILILKVDFNFQFLKTIFIFYF